MGRRQAAGQTRSQTGFTYLAILFAVTFLGIGLVAVSEVWTTASQRDKEEELLQVGEELRDAIGRYYNTSPAGNNRYPASLEDLLKDNRFATVRRHIRQIYRDPMTNKRQWGVILSPSGGIMGVHSLSDGAPIKVAGFASDHDDFVGKGKYAEWLFVFVPQRMAIGSLNSLSTSDQRPVNFAAGSRR